MRVCVAPCRDALGLKISRLGCRHFHKGCLLLGFDGQALFLLILCHLILCTPLHHISEMGIDWWVHLVEFHLKHGETTKAAAAAALSALRFSTSACFCCSSSCLCSPSCFFFFSWCLRLVCSNFCWRAVSAAFFSWCWRAFSACRVNMMGWPQFTPPPIFGQIHCDSCWAN